MFLNNKDYNPDNNFKTRLRNEFMAEVFEENSSRKVSGNSSGWNSPKLLNILSGFGGGALLFGIIFMILIGSNLLLWAPNVPETRFIDTEPVAFGDIYSANSQASLNVLTAANTSLQTENVGDLAGFDIDQVPYNPEIKRANYSHTFGNLTLGPKAGDCEGLDVFPDRVKSFEVLEYVNSNGGFHYKFIGKDEKGDLVEYFLGDGNNTIHFDGEKARKFVTETKSEIAPDELLFPNVESLNYSVEEGEKILKWSNDKDCGGEEKVIFSELRLNEQNQIFFSGLYFGEVNSENLILHIEYDQFVAEKEFEEIKREFVFEFDAEVREV